MQAQQRTRLLQCGRNADDAQVEILLDKITMQTSQMWLIFHNHDIECAAVIHGSVLLTLLPDTG
ncbi:hypothetical protein SRABI106_02405 [Rahnella aquatilis]|nr:hypothetical protein SRABI106_02405 [Rahnella aquatilis]